MTTAELKNVLIGVVNQHGPGLVLALLAQAIRESADTPNDALSIPQQETRSVMYRAVAVELENIVGTLT